MRVNMAQLNQIAPQALGPGEIRLTSDGMTRTVDFQTLLQSLMGIQIDPLQISEQQEIEQDEQAEAESQLHFVVPGNLMHQPLTGIASDGQASGVEPLQAEGSKRSVESRSMDRVQLKAPANEAIKWVKEGLEVRIKDFVKTFQSELRVLEVTESTSAEAVSHTLKSYNNLQRIKFNEKAEEVSMDGWIDKRPDRAGKVPQLESEQGHSIEQRKHSVKPQLTARTEPIDKPLFKKSGQVSIESRDSRISMPTDQVVKGEVKDAKGIKIISNDREIREAMIESIRDTQMNGVSKVKIQLHPREMGHMEIELKLNGGRIEGEIKVMNAEVKSQIEQIITPVKEMMRNEQFDLKDFNITVMDYGNSQMHSGHHNQEQQTGSYIAEDLFAVSEEETQDLPADTRAINLLA